MQLLLRVLFLSLSVIVTLYLLRLGIYEEEINCEVNVVAETLR